MRHYLCLILPLLAMALTFTGCDDHSDTFLSKHEMEDILYDYHLADAMAQQAKGGAAANALEYRAAVLKKYGVSQEKFDTSMVYYMRHTDELHTIYQHLSDRMQQEADRLGATASGVTAAGDSADVWKGVKTMVLMPNQPYNLYTFNLKTDTTFHKGDRLVLSFKADFIFQDGMRDGIAYMAVRLGNDSIVTRNYHLSSSMPTSMEIDDNDSLGIKEIRGFFMLSKDNSMNASSTTLQLMCIHDIQLIRVHARPQPAGQQPMQPMQSQIPVNPDVPDSQRMRPMVTR